ncbi:uncharacterized protein Dana_GF27956, isoform A [Drosophila ananassae]|uniref:Uncharacterized protein, isoform A n=1 Tax=Drosophila ananassae TaxID=7217 RepID=A0A0N8P0S7_DROAN|nr:uncharacterized protein Dana_GF27956, isoform A [Drosophila ananassae]
MYNLVLRFFLLLVCFKWIVGQFCGNCSSENSGKCTIDETASYKCLNSEFLKSTFLLKIKSGVQFHPELKGSMVPEYNSDMSACFIDDFKFNPIENFSVCCVYSRERGCHLVVARKLENYIPCGLCRMPEFPNKPGGICPCKELYDTSRPLPLRSSSKISHCSINAFIFGFYVITIIKILFFGI